jgi:hypothetical protein
MELGYGGTPATGTPGATADSRTNRVPYHEPPTPKGRGQGVHQAGNERRPASGLQ